MNDSQKCILLVEDEALIAIATAEKIRGFQYNVIIACTGEKAIETVLLNKEISLVLMDIDLGKGMNGTEAAKHILEKREIPVVFLTSHAEKDMVEKVKGITRYGYVIKDSGDFVLQSSIEMAFELFESHQKTQTTLELLQQSEFKYEAIFNGAAEGILIADIITKKFAYANPKICSMFGYTLNEILNLHVHDIHPAEQLPEIFTIFEEQTTGELFLAPEIPCLRKDGTVFFADINTSTIKINDKLYNLCFFEDISQRRLSEIALSESEERYRQVVDHSPYAIGIHQDDKLVFVNESAVKLFRATSADELLGKNIRSFIHPDNWSKTEIIKEQWLRGEKILYPHEDKYVRLDGSVVPVEVTVAQHFYNGKPAVQVIALDISDRKDAYKTLQNSEIEWKAIFDSIPNPIVILDAYNNIIRMNKILQEKLGKTVEDLKGVKCWQIFHNQDSLWPPQNCPYERMRKSGKVETMDMSVEAFGGYYIISCTPIFNESNELIKVIHIATDITDFKNAEARIQSLLDEKELLLAELNHRIKNTLNSISSLVYLQTNAVDNETAKKELSDLNDRIRAISMVYDKLQQNRNHHDVSVKDYLSTLIDSMCSIYPKKGFVQFNKNIEDIQINHRSLFPMGLIVNELVTNSIKHAFKPDSGNVISINLNKNDEIIILQIVDNGTGLKNTAHTKKNSGIGLKLVNNLVHQLEGEIETSSSNGTAVTITFPYHGQR